VLQALELVPDAEGQERVRRDWQALRDAGLPSQLDHRGPSNAPHLTLVAGPLVDDAAQQWAAEQLGALLPLAVRTAGLVVLGGPRVTLARLVDVDDALTTAVLAVRGRVPKRQHRGWLPHLTLVRRLPRADVQQAVDVLGHEDETLQIDALRHWDPDTRTTTTLAKV
jgi:2'-5' RNA ligase superfamily